jgi:hypothetical protein
LTPPASRSVTRVRSVCLPRLSRFVESFCLYGARRSVFLRLPSTKNSTLRTFVFDPLRFLNLNAAESVLPVATHLRTVVSVIVPPATDFVAVPGVAAGFGAPTVTESVASALLPARSRNVTLSV